MITGKKIPVLRAEISINLSSLELKFFFPVLCQLGALAPKIALAGDSDRLQERNFQYQSAENSANFSALVLKYFIPVIGPLGALSPKLRLAAQSGPLQDLKLDY